jgi:hypothetical protein
MSGQYSFLIHPAAMITMKSWMGSQCLQFGPNGKTNPSFKNGQNMQKLRCVSHVVVFEAPEIDARLSR